MIIFETSSYYAEYATDWEWYPWTGMNHLPLTSVPPWSQCSEQDTTDQPQPVHSEHLPRCRWYLDQKWSSPRAPCSCHPWLTASTACERYDAQKHSHSACVHLFALWTDQRCLVSRSCVVYADQARASTRPWASEEFCLCALYHKKMINYSD